MLDAGNDSKENGANKKLKLSSLQGIPKTIKDNSAAALNEITRSIAREHAAATEVLFNSDIMRPFKSSDQIREENAWERHKESINLQEKMTVQLTTSLRDSLNEHSKAMREYQESNSKMSQKMYDASQVMVCLVLLQIMYPMMMFSYGNKDWNMVVLLGISSLFVLYGAVYYMGLQYKQDNTQTEKTLLIVKVWLRKHFLFIVGILSLIGAIYLIWLNWEYIISLTNNLPNM